MPSTWPERERDTDLRSVQPGPREPHNTDELPSREPPEEHLNLYTLLRPPTETTDAGLSLCASTSPSIEWVILIVPASRGGLLGGLGELTQVNTPQTQKTTTLDGTRWLDRPLYGFPPGRGGSTE